MYAVESLLDVNRDAAVRAPNNLDIQNNDLTKSVFDDFSKRCGEMIRQ